MKKPYSESCDQNRDPILSIIEPVLANCSSVLEIGSGTGQHAVYFADKMPHLVWQTSDRIEYLSGIQSWLDDANLKNTPPPLQLDVSQSDWPPDKFDALFSANTAHIMSWSEVVAFFSGINRLLNKNGKVILYGPFNYNNTYTSDSNARFDYWLKQRDPDSGIRNFEDINNLAAKANLALINDFSMPANNRILYWQMPG